MSSNCNILLTLYAISFTGEVVAFVSQYPNNPRGNVILFGVLLYTCSEIISELMFFSYFIDDIVILKNLLLSILICVILMDLFYGEFIDSS